MDLLNILGKLQAEQPEVAEAVGNLRKAVLGNSHLDAKTANLVAIGIAAATRNQDALAGHIQLAKQAGAGRDEVTGAVLMAMPAAGIPAALAALPLVWEIFE